MLPHRHQWAWAVSVFSFTLVGHGIKQVYCERIHDFAHELDYADSQRQTRRWSLTLSHYGYVSCRLSAQQPSPLTPKQDEDTLCPVCPLGRTVRFAGTGTTAACFPNLLAAGPLACFWGLPRCWLSAGLPPFPHRLLYTSQNRRPVSLHGSGSVLLHARQNLEVAAEVGLPVMDRDELLAILSSDELRFVDLGTIVDDCLQVSEAGDVVAPESLLQQTKAPVGGKLCVPCNKKVEGDGPVLASQHSPGTVPQHVAILVLPRAVVTVQAGISLSQAIPCEEEVEEQNDSIRPL